MAAPVLYAQYGRREVHDIFEPATPFTSGSGTWGIRGIIPLGDQPGDFVLFVTFGKQEGDHLFDESISSEGVLRWESEPKQTLTSGRVLNLIQHNERTNTVHLFLRTDRLSDGIARLFTYLGPLKYLNHDAEREQPVHVAWQLLQWPIPPEIHTAMALTIMPEENFSPHSSVSVEVRPNLLIEEDAPTSAEPPGEPTRSFTARKRRYLSSDESRDLGLRGERLVLQREIDRLSAAGRNDLASQVVHTSVINGDGAGYDIQSYFPDGDTKYIEVKTTTGPKTSDFLISPNEIAFSSQRASNFELCRVFDYDSVRNSAKSFSIFGDLSGLLFLTETQYRARVMGTSK